MCLQYEMVDNYAVERLNCNSRGIGNGHSDVERGNAEDGNEKLRSLALQFSMS